MDGTQGSESGTGDELVVALSSGSSRSSSPWPSEDEADAGAAAAAAAGAGRTAAYQQIVGAPMVLTLGPAREVRGAPAADGWDAEGEGAPRLSVREELLLDPDFAEPDRSAPPRDPGAFTAEERERMTAEERRESRKVINLRLQLCEPLPRAREATRVRIGLLGNMFAGKSCLVDTFVHGGAFTSTPPTLGMGFITREVVLASRRVAVTFYDLGGRREDAPLLPMTVFGASAVLYVVDLTDVASINALKDWYRQGKLLGPRLNVLVGTKYDLFADHDPGFRQKIVAGTTSFARAMHAPLFFTSAYTNTNITELFRVVLSIALGIECALPEITDPNEPLRRFRPPFCPEGPLDPEEPPRPAPAPKPEQTPQPVPVYDSDFCFGDSTDSILQPRTSQQAPQPVPVYDSDFCFGDDTDSKLQPRTRQHEEKEKEEQQKTG